ncbi:uncharacterized protein LOC143728967 [Siphateles boraxobius]|uniref:uncharacterized protein LOC143728967 n=1 Tax=Siphateles boraxobius TaxID=180520 RepID=UPI004064B76F
MLRFSQDGAVATDILQLPDDILQRILVFVVLQDGCSAIPRLALTCQRLNNIVSQEHFQQEAHFSWLDSVVNWKRLSERHRQMYRKPYTSLYAGAYNAASFTKTVGLATTEMDNGECFWGFTPQMTTLATVAGIAFWMMEVLNSEVCVRAVLTLM